MPYTFVRLEELQKIEEIKQFLIANLWNKKFTEEQTITLSTVEEDAVAQVGLALFGS